MLPVGLGQGVLGQLCQLPTSVPTQLKANQKLSRLRPPGDYSVPAGQRLDGKFTFKMNFSPLLRNIRQHPRHWHSFRNKEN